MRQLAAVAAAALNRSRIRTRLGEALVAFRNLVLDRLSSRYQRSSSAATFYTCKVRSRNSGAHHHLFLSYRGPPLRCQGFRASASHRRPQLLHSRHQELFIVRFLLWHSVLRTLHAQILRTQETTQRRMMATEPASQENIADATPTADTEPVCLKDEPTAS